MAGRCRISLEERFWEKVERSEGCWLWQAAIAMNGYGRFRMPTGHLGAHVVAYILTYGSVPTGLEVHHTCETRGCVRPDHLVAVTHRTNLLSSNTLPGINVRKTHCVHGHEFSRANTYISKERKRMCRQCKVDRRTVRNGDIGEPKRYIEFEPLPESVPIEEPAAPAPEPEKVPAE